MRVSRRQFIERGSAFTFAAVGLRAGAVQATPNAPTTRARQATAAPMLAVRTDWERLSFAGRVTRLITPSSGALFAVIARNENLADFQGGLLFRSDDTGVSWRPVPMPPQARDDARPGVFGDWTEIDPTNHDLMFASGKDGLYRTADAGGTWTLVYPSDSAFRRVEVSPADHNAVYAVTARYYSSAATIRFVRSGDGGLTWEDLNASISGGCSWGGNYLAPHPTDPDRVFCAFGCANSTFSDIPFWQSRDGGRTWGTVVLPDDDDKSTDALKAHADQRIVGGYPAQPTRLYVGANRKHQVGGCFVFRSDDDGASWTIMLSRWGGSTYTGLTSNMPTFTLNGITADINDPDRLFIALDETFDLGNTARPVSGHIMVTTDAAATWTEIGTEFSNALALGIDGKYLYCANNQGISRLAL